MSEEMTRYLIVANQTLLGAHLVEKISECLAAGPCRFHVLVPATPPPLMVTAAEGSAHDVARRRLDEAVDRFRDLGASVTGEVGHEIAIVAIAQVVHREGFDEVILSTLPEVDSRWLREGLPRRLARAFGIKVTHLVARGV